MCVPTVSFLEVGFHYYLLLRARAGALFDDYVLLCVCPWHANLCFIFQTNLMLKLMFALAMLSRACVLYLCNVLLESHTKTMQIIYTMPHINTHRGGLL